MKNLMERIQLTIHDLKTDKIITDAQRANKILAKLLFLNLFVAWYSKLFANIFRCLLTTG